MAACLWAAAILDANIGVVRDLRAVTSIDKMPAIENFSKFRCAGISAYTNISLSLSLTSRLFH